MFASTFPTGFCGGQPMQRSDAVKSAAALGDADKQLGLI